MLARKGARVLLLERDAFPRDHIGESLLPASVPVLEELGVRDAVEAAFPKKFGATMVWGRDREPWSWYFRETSARYPHAYQVWRPDFDKILLDNARANGVQVREGARVAEVLDRGVRLEDGSAIESAFVVDASGQSALIGNSRGLRRWDPVFRNMAVYAYFAPARRLPDPDATNILVESYADGWLWTIPLPGDLASVGAVIDRDTSKRLRKGTLDRFLAKQIASAPHTRALVGESPMVHGPFVLRDWSYVSDSLVGDGWILAGDAACFVDPLFSSGVHLALSAGVLSAAYVTTALKDLVLAAAAAPVYSELYMTQYRHFHEMARLFYSSNRTIESYFWEARRILGDSDYTPREAFIRAVAGQPPRGYERVVVEMGEPPSGFSQGLREAESGLRERSATAAGPAFLESVPRLTSGAEVRRSAVLGAGEFEWGHLIVTPARPQGVECSRAVAKLVGRIDGCATVRELAGTDAELTALRALYIDGATDVSA
jgi:flavin-dependent dehydrogenase